MNDNIQTDELPEHAMEHLSESVALARACASYRAGYEVELEAVSPVIRNGNLNLILSWRRKPVGLRLVS